MKFYKLFSVFILFSLCSLLFISCGKKNKYRGFTIHKSGGKFDILVSMKVTGLIGLKSKQKLLIQNADSIITSYKYGTMIHGLNPENQMKSWFYIDTSNPANFYGPYSDEEFRTDEITTIGRNYLDSVLVIEEYLNHSRKK